MGQPHSLDDFHALGEAPEIAIIIPTFNEVQNVAPLAARIGEVLGAWNYEIIFVDDHSPDGTAQAVRDLGVEDSRIRVIERIGRRGLSSAVIEGLLATSAPYAIVMDGDLQHDEKLAPSMLDALRKGADLVVGSRYTDGGDTGDWSRSRRRVSKLATSLSRLLGSRLVSDPMSGFFGLRTDMFRGRADQLLGSGYKILMDLLSTSGPALKIVELPYVFRSRQFGQSKLDAKIILQFIELMLEKLVGRYVPVKFVMFIMMGVLGVGVHFLALSLLLLWQPFKIAEIAATMIAMTANFFTNNAFTYHDRRLKGWSLLRGWATFCVASSVGLIANVSVAVYLNSFWGFSWYFSALVGIALGAILNYLLTSIYTWKS